MKFLLPSLALLLLQNLVGIFVLELYVVVFTLSYPKGSSYTSFMNELMQLLEDDSMFVAMSFAYAIAGVLVFAPWYIHTKKKLDANAPADSLKLYPPILFVGIILFALATQYVSAYAIEVISYLKPEWMEIYQEMLEASGLDGSTGYSIIMILYVCIIGPISEELCFRGITYQYARTTMSFFSANLVQALLFGAVHMNQMQSIYTFALGFLFGMIYEKTRNIYITILVHIAFNTGGMFLERFIQLGDTPVIFYLTLFASMSAAYFAYRLILRAEAERTMRLENVTE